MLRKIHAAGLPSNLGRNPAECRRSIPKFRRLSTARVLNYSAHGNRTVKHREQHNIGALLQNQHLFPAKKDCSKNPLGEDLCCVTGFQKNNKEKPLYSSFSSTRGLREASISADNLSIFFSDVRSGSQKLSLTKFAERQLQIFMITIKHYKRVKIAYLKLR